jgi:anti-sigma B factor antagonist
MNLESIVSTDFDYAVVELDGRFDAYEAPRVREWMDEQLTRGVARLIVDLEAVTFIDSTALAVLVQGMKRSRQQDGDLILCGLQQPVRIIFELTRLDKAFRIYGARDEALASA